MIQIQVYLRHKKRFIHFGDSPEARDSPRAWPKFPDFSRNLQTSNAPIENKDRTRFREISLSLYIKAFKHAFAILESKKG